MEKRLFENINSLRVCLVQFEGRGGEGRGGEGV
jgi:hypothetical protein